MVQSLRVYLKIALRQLRIQTYVLLVLYLFVAVLCGAVMTIEPSLTIRLVAEILLCATILALWYINGSALNDYADYEIDQINLKGDPDRPLIIHKATKLQILRLATVCAIGAIFISLFLSPKHAIVVCALLLLNVAYSIKPIQISRRGGLAPLLLPLGYILLPFSLGYALFDAPVTRFVIVVFVAFYLHFIGRIILKDYRDVKGDAKFGKKTFLLAHGNTAVCVASGVAISTSACLLIFAEAQYFQVFRYGIMCLMAFGLAILYQLNSTTSWKEQKPLLATFGRAMTGVTALVIASFVAELWYVSLIERIILMLVITGVYIWSAKQAFVYNTLTIQNKHAHGR